MDHIQPLGDLILSPDDVQVYFTSKREREWLVRLLVKVKVKDKILSALCELCEVGE